MVEKKATKINNAEGTVGATAMAASNDDRHLQLPPAAVAQLAAAVAETSASRSRSRSHNNSRKTRYRQPFFYCFLFWGVP